MRRREHSRRLEPRRVATRYQAVNIKLDKAGGLTRALARQARARNMVVVVG